MSASSGRGSSQPSTVTEDSTFALPDDSSFALREYLSGTARSCGTLRQERTATPSLEEDSSQAESLFSRQAGFLLRAAVFVADFLLRSAAMVIFVRHRLPFAIACMSIFQGLSSAIAIQVMFCDADVRRWLRTGSRLSRAIAFPVIFLVLGCCQVIHVKRSLSRQLHNAEVLRHLEGRDFLWAGPVLGGDRTLPVALLSGVPFALLYMHTFLNLDCTFEGKKSPGVRRFCEQERQIESSILAAGTFLAVSVVAWGVVDIDLAVSGFVSRRYHLDRQQSGSRAGRLQFLYPAVHIAFRMSEVLLRVLLITEGIVLARMLLGGPGILLAVSLLFGDLAVGILILWRHAPASEPLMVHVLVGVGVLLANVVHFVDRPCFCWPAARITRVLGAWRLLQTLAVVLTAALGLYLGHENRVLSSVRAVHGLEILSAATAFYGLLWLTPMIRRTGDDLHTAALRRHPRRLRKLLEAGVGGEAVDVNGRSKDGEAATPLMLAAAAGDLDCLRLLVAAGARVQARDGHGETCLHRAVEGCHSEALEFLLAQQGAKRAVSQVGSSLWNLAGRMQARGRSECLESLLSSKSAESKQPFQDASLRSVHPHFATGGNLCHLFPDELPDAIPPPHELNSVSSLVLAHASGAMAQAVLPAPGRSCWLEQLTQVRILGQGAMGKVLEVETTPSGDFLSATSSPCHGSSSSSPGLGPSRYAMKLQAKTQAEASWQACAEVVALRRAIHPFIVRLEHAFQTPQYYVLLLELCPGGDLNQVLSRPEHSSGLPAVTAARYGGQILLALLHLHEVLGIIYRDVKPQNVLISSADEAKLADFGTAQYVGGSAGTTRLSLVGTRGFLAPELVVAGGGDAEESEDDEFGSLLDPFKTDAYSFGMTLELLLLGAAAAEEEQEDGCLLPRMQPESEALRMLDREAEQGRLSAEAAALLSLLVLHSPAERKCLSDPLVRHHPFFLKTLNCQDLDLELLPPVGPAGSRSHAPTWSFGASPSRAVSSHSAGHSAIVDRRA